MVVSTSHLDPMDAFDKLVQQQNLQQQQSPVKLPKWFMTNIYKYFVLLHDVTDGEESKYEKNNFLKLKIDISTQELLSVSLFFSISIRK
jgi:hypothetical protein